MKYKVVYSYRDSNGMDYGMATCIDSCVVESKNALEARKDAISVAYNSHLVISHVQIIKVCEVRKDLKG